MFNRRDDVAVIPAQAGTHAHQSFALSPAAHNHDDTAYGSPLARGRQRSIAGARRLLAHQFRTAGVDAPELDARILVGHALGLDHAALAAQAERPLTAAEAEAVAALARRRLAREPVARILGVKEFWGLPFKLNSDTLVPRPETETVVEAALDAAGADRTRPLRIADLGTGSGALLLALLTELPMAHGVGTDLSEAALTCARANATALGLAARASFTMCDFGAALARGFDLVVANPPYVGQAELAALQPEVRDYDPNRALGGGVDGLAAYRAIAADARRLLGPQGALVLELGAGQLGAVRAILAGAGLTAPGRVRCDLAGTARALTVGAPAP
jgi:release factor glutamine methyltransferase